MTSSQSSPSNVSFDPSGRHHLPFLYLDTLLTVASLACTDNTHLLEARAYYIRLCLHNWQDKECIAILTRIRKAMKPKYSRLIIHEQVMPDHGTHPWASVSDINQMGATASFERTKGDWAALLKEVGLEEPKFYFPKDPSSAVAIESILKG